jgi:lysozyme
MNRAVLRAALSRDEGRRAKVYRDSLGIETIGVGRNLRDKGLSEAEIDLLLDNDIAEIASDLTVYFPWFAHLDEVRQHVVLNMRFQLGPSRFRGFRQMLAALDRGDYQSAADSMQASKWATQVPTRATRLIAEMRTGQASDT